MKLVIDESVVRSVIERLRHDGHEVVAIAEIAPSSPDAHVLAMANGLGVPLITADKDFGELVFRQGSRHHGYVLLRLGGLCSDEKAEIVGSFIRDHEGEIHGAVCVLTREGFRIRRRIATAGGA